jgi:hypothetical protein
VVAHRRPSAVDERLDTVADDVDVEAVLGEPVGPVRAVAWCLAIIAVAAPASAWAFGRRSSP